MNSSVKQFRKRGWRKFALNVLLFAAVIGGIRAWQQRDMPGGPAPALHGVLLDGALYSLPAQPARPVLVHFWASWCPVCRAEQDAITAIAQDHSQTITIAMQSGTPAQIAQYLGEHGLRFPVLNDPDGRIAAAWGVRAVPASFIVAPDGEIRFVEVGYTTGPGLRARLWLAALLGV